MIGHLKMNFARMNLHEQFASWNFVEGGHGDSIFILDLVVENFIPFKGYFGVFWTQEDGCLGHFISFNVN